MLREDMEAAMRIALIATALVLACTEFAAAQTPSAGAAKDTSICLDVSHIDHTSVIDDRTILFYMRGGKIWKNTLREDCPSLKFERAFSEELYGGEICSNAQMIRVIETGARCSLGGFTPYMRSAKAASN